MNITERTKELIVVGMKDGGKIPMPLIDAFLVRAYNQLYRDTEMTAGELPLIDEVTGESIYTLEDPAVGQMVRLISLSRNDSALQPEEYTQGFLAPADGTDGGEAIGLINPSTQTAVGALRPIAVLSFDDEGYIPSMHSEDSFEAVYGLLRFFIGSQTAKSWGNGDEASIGLGEYRDAVSRIKHKVLRGGTSRNLKMKSTVSFI